MFTIQNVCLIRSIDTLIIVTEKTRLHANTGKYIGVSRDEYKLYDVTIPSDNIKYYIKKKT